MRTKKYKKWLATLVEKNAVPQELYYKMLGEIERDGKMTKRVFRLFMTELERRRLFDVPVVPYSENGSARTDGRFKYRHKNPFWIMWHAFARGVAKLCGILGGGIGYGVWRVKDAKKLKGIGACITVSNHIGYLDPLLTMRSLLGRRRYIVVAPYNCKRNLGGFLLKGACELPLPVSFNGTRAFSDALAFAARKKSAIHMYAEQAMWPHYKKPRPLKDGAFVYADKLDIPIVPMHYCFGKARGLRKLLHMPKVTIRIGEPIYADKSLAPRLRATDLRARTEAAIAQMYEDFYGMPLEYEPNFDGGLAEAEVAATADCAEENVSVEAKSPHEYGNKENGDAENVSARSEATATADAQTQNNG